MKTMKKIMSFLLVISIFMTTLSCGLIPASAQTTENLNVKQLDGADLPIKELKGLPDDIRYINFYNNEDNDPTSRQELDYYVANGGCYIDEEHSDLRYFISYSADGEYFTTLYADEFPQTEKYEMYSNVEFHDISIEEYANKTFYISIGISYTNDGWWCYDYLYLKTENFTEWEEITEIPYYEKELEITLPENSYPYDYKGEYNGIYVVEKENERSDEGIRIHYYISDDGENWKEKVTPEIAFPEDECGSPPYYEEWGNINVTESGVIFSVTKWSVAYCSRAQVEFNDFLITTDFNNYQKINMSALGDCKGNLDIEQMLITYDAVSMGETMYDFKPLFFRHTAVEGLIKEDYYDENYNDGIAYYPDDEYVSFDTEVYTLNEETMALEKWDTLKDCYYYWYWAYSMNHMWLMSQTLAGEWYINIYEGDEQRKYAWEGTESFRAFTTCESYDDEGSLLNEDNMACVKYLIGIKNNNTLFLTNNSFKNCYEFSLDHIADEIYFENFYHNGELIFSTPEGKYYSVDYDDMDAAAFEITEPSMTTIRYKDGIILHTNKENAEIEWTCNNDNFSVEENDDGTITIVSKDNGYTEITASAIGEDGNVIATDSVELRSKAGFFDKIGGFFRGLFGTTKVYDA